MTRKQKLTHWEKLLKQQNLSGKSFKKFCDQNHLNYKTALRWRNIIEAMSNDKISTPVEFIELPSTPQIENYKHNSTDAIKFQFNGINMEFPGGFDQDVFWKIMSLIRGVKSC